MMKEKKESEEFEWVTANKVILTLQLIFQITQKDASGAVLMCEKWMRWEARLNPQLCKVYMEPSS